jgi:hypothetical protein
LIPKQSVAGFSAGEKRALSASLHAMVSTVLTTGESGPEFGITQTDGGAAIYAGVVVRVSIGVGVGV